MPSWMHNSTTRMSPIGVPDLPILAPQLQVCYQIGHNVILLSPQTSPLHSFVARSWNCLPLQPACTLPNKWCPRVQECKASQTTNPTWLGSQNFRIPRASEPWLTPTARLLCISVISFTPMAAANDKLMIRYHYIDIKVFGDLHPWMQKSVRRTLLRMMTNIGSLRPRQIHVVFPIYKRKNLFALHRLHLWFPSITVNTPKFIFWMMNSQACPPSTNFTFIEISWVNWIAFLCPPRPRPHESCLPESHNYFRAL